MPKAKTQEKPKRVPGAYARFSKEYAAKCKAEGKAFNIRDAAAAWKAQRGEPSNDGSLPVPDKPDISKNGPRFESPILSADAQGSGIIAPNGAQPQTVTTQPGNPAPVQPVQQVTPLDSYRQMAVGIHAFENQGLKMWLGISIDPELLEILNDAGARLIQKYDPDGDIAEYGPELAYATAQGSVLLQVVQKRRSMLQSAPVEPVEPPIEQALKKDSRTDNRKEKLPWEAK